MLLNVLISTAPPQTRGSEMFIKDKSELKQKFRALFEQAEHLIDGGSIDVEVKKHVHKRSNAQNNYYWVICEELAAFFQEKQIYEEYDAFGVHIKRHFTKDSVHDKLNKPLLGVETTTKMSVQEFCDYMTKIIHYWQEQTKWLWMPSELPAAYLAQRGYTDNYFH